MVSTHDDTNGLITTLRMGIFAIVLFANPFLHSLGAVETESKSLVFDIFAARCLRCHNEIDRKGDFSLQTALELTESGYISPGDVKASHLLEVIGGDPAIEATMPKNAERLTEEEIAAVTDWIANGAEWPSGLVLEEPKVTNFEWWSFQPVTKPSVPTWEDGEAKDWVRTPVDAFILQALREKKLTFSPEADRRTLIRRVTYDLTGLPPTPKEVESFLADSDPQAYELLVERLLSSPQYGEHWARHWLDVVKYADTCGYDKDKLRLNAWPYRDYVIRSMNEDKLYRTFVQEQIAGDVLFPGNPDGILGLGFVAAGPWDFIGHVEVPEAKIDGQVARHLDRDEMVTNTLNTFSSLTIQCARCHNHKFDPFTQEHYYGMQAIFAAVDRAERPYDLDPSVEQRRRELNEQLVTLRVDEVALDEEIRKEGGESLAALEKRIEELAAIVIPINKRPEFGFHSSIAATSDVEKWVQIDFGRTVKLGKVVVRPTHDDFNGIGAGFGFPVRFAVSTGELDGEDSQILLDCRSDDFTNPGLAPVEIDAKGIETRFLRVTATRLAERKDDFILALAELEAFDKEGNNVGLNATVDSLDSIEAPDRWRRTNLTDGIFPQSKDPSAAMELRDRKSKLAALFAEIDTPDRKSRRSRIEEQIQQADEELMKLPVGKMVYAAATNFPPFVNFKPTKGVPRAVHVLHRGNIQQPRQEVSPGAVPLNESFEWQFAIDKEASEGARRAALARWLTHRDHPTSWRSIANRIWLYHFGEGLVASPNDFGRMGQLPTHPHLLDWLAAEFRDNGQSFKDMHRLLVNSAVYRQASTDNATGSAIDGSNRYLWRMNRRRLTAEEIRDSVLSVSGRLNTAMGGPGFYLFVLEKADHSPHYEYYKFDPNDVNSHRRSVYRFVVRSQPDPFMTTLDCADSSQSTPKRNETLTSLQALSLLNSQFNLVMAKEFAKRIRAEADEMDDQVSLAFRLVTGRSPTPIEHSQFEKYAADHGPENLCRILFNLNEFIFID